MPANSPHAAKVIFVKKIAKYKKRVKISKDYLRIKNLGTRGDKNIDIVGKLAE